MKPRDRVLTALNHQVPDRVPIDLGGNQTGIHKYAYRDLIEHLGIRDELNDHGRRAAARQAVRGGARTVSRRYALYFRRGGRRFQGRNRARTTRNGKLWHDLTDEFGVVWSMPDDHPYYMDISHHPLANATLDGYRGISVSRRATIPPDSPTIRQAALAIRNETPYAVVSGISGVVYETCWYLRGLERWFMDMVEQPEFCEALLEQTLKFWLDWFRLFLDEVGDLVDVIMVGDDLAGQTGPLFRPDFYRRVVKPRQKRLVQYIHSRTQAKVWYHTCGACRPTFPT